MKWSSLKQLSSGLAAMTIAASAHADLVHMDDSELAEFSGQAFITIDNYSVTQTTGSYSAPAEEIDTEFYRVNIGAEIETNLSIDHLELGKFARYENGEPCPSTGCDPSRMQELNSADVSIRNFALGTYEENNGIVEAKPFKAINPFIEFAFEHKADGTRSIVGARLGFEQSGGILSGDIDSLTGNIDVIIEGEERVLGLPIPIKAQALLQYGEEGDPNGDNNGSFDPIRASYIGILDDADIRAFPGLGGGIPISPSDCRTSTGTDTCQPLGQFQSLEVGKASDTGLVNNFFLSSQSKDIAWVVDPQGNLTPNYDQDPNGKTVVVDPNFTQTYLGGFVNIPSGGLILTPEEATHGLPRLPTRYTDAALGLF